MKPAPPTPEKTAVKHTVAAVYDRRRLFWRLAAVIDRRYRGQTLIFMLMLMIILTFVAFSVYDTQHVVVQRVRTQVAADSAALTGARWQLASLNAIGEINLIKVTTDIVVNGPQPYNNSEGNYPYTPLFSALDKLQAKIAITGPMMGVLYGEQAAKLNGMHAVTAYANQFQALAQWVQANAGNPNMLNDHWLQPPIFNPGNPADMQERQQLLVDYAALMQEIANQGMGALPNIFPPDLANAMDWSQANPYAEQYLPDPAFYAAIAAQDWCFLKNLLNAEPPDDTWNFWGQVYLRYGIDPFRILNLRLTPQADAYMGQVVVNGGPPGMDTQYTIIQNQLTARGLTQNPNWPGGTTQPPLPFVPRYGFTSTNDYPEFDNSSAFKMVERSNFVPLNWAVYRPGWYNQWNAGVIGQYLNGTVRDQYNYAYQYADSVWFSQSAASVTMAVPNYKQTSWTAAGQSAQLSQDLNDLSQLRDNNSTLGSSGIQASAYAKAFGAIDASTPPTQCPVVLPVFTDVRLIPSVVSSVANGLDIGFMEHVLSHIPPYTQRGFYTPGCIYCNDLKLWDNSAFRQSGLTWLATHTCPVGGGGGGGGIIAH